MKLQTENPIESSHDDTLNRKDFSKNLSKQISEYKDINGLTIGLMGGWGCGKSSILNMIKENFDEKIIETVDFTPWYFSGREQLISDFFEVLSESIKFKDSTETKTELSKALKKYSNILKPLSLIPVPFVATAIGAVTTCASGLGNYLNDSCSDISLDNTKKEINKELKEYGKKIAVFIDEIDRLDNTEICEIFQLVRALGDFNNIIYILAFDQEKVCEIANLNKGYFDKIINIPIYIPNIIENKLNTTILKELQENIEIKKNEKGYWETIYHNLFCNYFLNLREIYRFVNVLKFNQGFIMKEVNQIDFAVITFLHLFEPEVYQLINKRENDLCWCRGFGDKRKPENFVQAIKQFNKIKLNRSFNIEKVIKTIFSDVRILNDKQINNLRYFSSYFVYALDDNIYNYDNRKELLSIKTIGELEKFIGDKETLDFLENIFEMCNEFRKEHLILIIQYVLGEISNIQKDDYKINTNTQKNCFKKLKSLVLEFDKNDIDSMQKIISFLEVSDKVKFASFVDFLLSIKLHFGNSKCIDDFISNVIEPYISARYNNEIYNSFPSLEQLGVDLNKYVNKIILDTKLLFQYLKDIEIVIDVHQSLINDKFGEVVDAEYFEKYEISLEDLNNYTSKETILDLINKLPEKIKTKKRDIICLVEHARPVEEINNDMESRNGF